MSKGAIKEVNEQLENPNLNPAIRFLLEQYLQVESGKGGPEYVDAPKSQIAEYLMRLALGATMSEQGDIVKGSFVPASSVSISTDLLDKLLELAWERASAIDEAFKEGDDVTELNAIADCLTATTEILYPEDDEA